MEEAQARAEGMGLVGEDDEGASPALLEASPMQAIQSP
jgi:hypothetical protein